MFTCPIYCPSVSLTFPQLRLLHGFTHTVRASRLRLSSTPGPSTLFLPVITTSRSSPYECDYNLHKSNSTYFSDFDVGRLDLLVTLAGKGIDRTRKELSSESGGFRIALGGVATNFRREIKPFQKFEVWTRILCWDRKWLYLVGHFVQPGSVRRKRWVLQPWKDGNTPDKADDEGGKKEPTIFASAIAKYCCKKGRLTIPPERILTASELLPPKPAEHETPPVSETPDVQANGDAVAAVPELEKAAETLAGESAGEVLAASLTPKEGKEWDWRRVESERLRGMKVAELYAGLDRLNDEFNGGEGWVLGQY